MNIVQLKRMTKIVVGGGIGMLVLVMAIQKIQAIRHAKQFQAVLLTGRHHMGPNFSVSDFYVNGYAGGNAGREGGGGGAMCCVLLPKTWRQGLVAEVRWQVGDWTYEHDTPKRIGAFNNARWETYRAIVPIERYENAEHMYVHFFTGGRVRIVSSLLGTEHADHPISSNDVSAGAKASVGVVIPEIFTKAELEEMRAKMPRRRTW